MVATILLLYGVIDNKDRGSQILSVRLFGSSEDTIIGRRN